MLKGIDRNWEIVGVDVPDPAQAEEYGSHDLVIFSLPSEPASANAELAVARQLTQPAKMMLLCDVVDGEFPDVPLYENVFGYVSKAASIALLEASIKVVMAGGECFPSRTWPASRHADATDLAIADCDDMALGVEVDCVDAELLNITPRQYEVLLLLSRGYPIKTVSRMLNISVATAKTHAYKLYRALNVSNKSEAVYEALRRGATLDWVPVRNHMPAQLSYEPIETPYASLDVVDSDYDIRQAALF